VAALRPGVGHALMVHHVLYLDVTLFCTSMATAFLLMTCWVPHNQVGEIQHKPFISCCCCCCCCRSGSTTTCSPTAPP
jgi:hypothetical protein